MPTDEAEDNRRYCKDYYQRLKADPKKLAERRAKKAAAQRARRHKRRVAPVTSPVASGPVASPKAAPPVTSLAPQPRPVTSPVTSPPEDPLARIHREYREECEALGYDVEGNRRAVYERIADKLADPNIRLTPPRTDFKGSPEDQGPSKKK